MKVKGDDVLFEINGKEKTLVEVLANVFRRIKELEAQVETLQGQLDEADFRASFMDRDIHDLKRKSRDA